MHGHQQTEAHVGELDIVEFTSEYFLRGRGTLLPAFV